MTKEKTAEKIRGYFLYSPFGKNRDGKYFFRVYHNSNNFTDYDIRAEEIEVTLDGKWISLYESDSGNNYLDWSSKTLGRPNKNS
jgi:hypothetical protein